MHNIKSINLSSRSILEALNTRNFFPFSFFFFEAYQIIRKHPTRERFTINDPNFLPSLFFALC